MMGTFEARVAESLRTEMGQHWYLYGAHPQTILDYVQADSEAEREARRNTMKRDAVAYANRCGRALKSAGIL